MWNDLHHLTVATLKRIYTTAFFVIAKFVLKLSGIRYFMKNFQAILATVFAIAPLLRRVELFYVCPFYV